MPRGGRWNLSGGALALGTARRQSMRNPHGTEFIDGREVGNTTQCPHCGGHFSIVAGSKKKRGWCFKCSAVHCGAPACRTCKPWEKQMEEMERRG